MPIQVTGTWVAVLVGLSLPAPTLAPWGKFKHFQAKFLQETGGPVARRGNRCWVANHQCALYYLFQRNHQIHAYRFEFTIYAYRFEYWEQRQQKFIFLTWFFLLIIIIIRKDFRTWQFCTLILTWMGGEVGVTGTVTEGQAQRSGGLTWFPKQRNVRCLSDQVPSEGAFAPAQRALHPLASVHVSLIPNGISLWLTHTCMCVYLMCRWVRCALKGKPWISALKWNKVLRLQWQKKMKWWETEGSGRAAWKLSPPRSSSPCRPKATLCVRPGLPAKITEAG